MGDGVDFGPNASDCSLFEGVVSNKVAVDSNAGVKLLSRLRTGSVDRGTKDCDCITHVEGTKVEANGIIAVDKVGGISEFKVDVGSSD